MRSGHVRRAGGARARPPAAPRTPGAGASAAWRPPRRSRPPRRGRSRAPGRKGRRAKPRRDAARDTSAAGRPRGRRRGRSRAGESGLPKYEPDIALRSIEGHLTRTGTQVMAWYRLAAQAWSFRSDSQREVLIRQIAAQLGELQGRWLHLRVTTRPYPVHMWAESFDNNALGRMPDVAGALGWDGFLEGEQRHLMGLSMSDKEVFLGIEVSGRSMLDRWVERAAPVLGRFAPGRGARRAGRAGLGGRATSTSWSAGSGLDAVPAAADDIAWLMHRSCALGLPAPRTLSVVPGGSPAGRPRTSPRSPTASSMYQEPYAPTVRVVGPDPVADRVAQRRRALGGADGGPAHPRGRRPVDAALRPAAVPGGVVGADLHPQTGGGGG